MIVVVRHGRTVSNAAGLLLGRADPDLDELGIDQARRLGAALGHEAGPAVDRIVTSPWRRWSLHQGLGVRTARPRRD